MKQKEKKKKVKNQISAKTKETTTKYAKTNNYCKGCGMIWYNCLCNHEED